MNEIDILYLIEFPKCKYEPGHDAQFYFILFLFIIIFFL